MKKIIKKLRNQFNIYFVLQCAYLIILALFIFCFTRPTIMGEVRWDEDFYRQLHALLISYTIIKFLFVKHEKFNVCEIILMAFLVYSCVMAQFYNGGFLILDFGLLVIAAKDIPYKSIVITYIIVKFPMIVSTIIRSQVGDIENLIYIKDGRIREAFGFGYPTDFAAHVLFLMLAWIILRQIKITYFELGMMLFITCILQEYCDPRCTVISMCLAIAYVTIVKLFRNDGLGSKFRCVVEKIIQAVCIVLPCLSSGVMILLSKYYDANNEIVAKINEALSNRLIFGSNAFSNWGVKLYGQYINMIGAGGRTEPRYGYNFIDCSYLNIMMQYGVFFLVATILILTYMIVKNRNDLMFIGLVAIVCIASAIEHHLIEYYYNFFILLIFADFGNTNSKKSKENIQDIKQDNIEMCERT